MLAETDVRACEHRGRDESHSDSPRRQSILWPSNCREHGVSAEFHETST
jgi:hypothetical protein